MPELPEVEGLRRFLAGELVGATVARAELAAFSALKTFAMPLSSLLGQEVERVERRGKFIGIGVDGAWLAFHLARAGWLRWYDTVPVAPARPGKGPIALRMGFDPSTGSGPVSYTHLDVYKRQVRTPRRPPGRRPVGAAYSGVGRRRFWRVGRLVHQLGRRLLPRAVPDPAAVDGWSGEGVRVDPV